MLGCFSHLQLIIKIHERKVANSLNLFNTIVNKEYHCKLQSQQRSQNLCCCFPHRITLWPKKADVIYTKSYLLPVHVNLWLPSSESLAKLLWHHGMFTNILNLAQKVLTASLFGSFEHVFEHQNTRVALLNQTSDPYIQPSVSNRGLAYGKVKKYKVTAICYGYFFFPTICNQEITSSQHKSYV